MDSEKHTEFLNYFLNKDKKYPARMYNLSPKNRDNQKANFRRLVKPFNVKNGTLYHGDVESVTGEDDAIPRPSPDRNAQIRAICRLAPKRSTSKLYTGKYHNWIET